MKKIVGLLVVLLSLFIFSVSISAAEKESNNDNDVYINEYEALKQLSKNSSSQLMNMGYSKDEIKVIQNLEEEYANHLKSYSKLSDNELDNLGYSEGQIDLLRTYKGTEEETIRLAATLNLRLNAHYVTHNSSTNRTNARLGFTWTWSGVPVFKTTDIIGVSWNDWSVTGSRASVTYVPQTGAPGTRYGTGTILSNSGPNSAGRGVRISMTQDDNYWWARSGSGHFDLRGNSANRKDLSAYAAYGHTTLSISPGFSIPGYGSINFNWGMQTVAQAWEDARVSN
ncbi:hypothetical protein ACDX78_16735 [Virgibacillus oceani]